MGSTVVDFALAARTPKELEQALKLLEESIDPEAPYAAEQVNKMREAIQAAAVEEERQRVLRELGLPDPLAE